MRVRSNSIARLDWYHALLSETILDYQVSGYLKLRLRINFSIYFRTSNTDIK